MTKATFSDAAWAVDAYEAVRHRLPPARPPGAAQPITGIDQIAGRYDAFLLDAFGVLNVGETAIPGAPEAVARLQAMGKRVLVLTNGATTPRSTALAKYRRLGFAFDPDDVVSSRDALKRGLCGHPGALWGVMGTALSDLPELGIEALLLGDDPQDHARCDGIILLGSGDWSEARQTVLTEALQARPRPVLVGNPDIVAPRETGLSLEPGHYAHRLAELPAIEPVFYGKPYGSIYDIALSRLPGIAPGRILAVGDTLHTDVLGGAAAGVDTFLTADYGLFATLDAPAAIARTGIAPTWIGPCL